MFNQSPELSNRLIVNDYGGGRGWGCLGNGEAYIGRGSLSKWGSL